MARSYRKTPITGITTAKSDGQWKAKAARRLRHKAKQVLKNEGHTDMLAGKRWDIVNPWDASKDGKQWLKRPNIRDMRK